MQENRKPTGLLTSYHGVAYQMQWMMVVALEAQERLNGKKSGAFKFKTIDFKTEDPDAGKFDDLVWRYETDKTSSCEYNFLQAKHKLDKEEKITIKELLKPKQKEDSSKSNEKDKRPFALEKYFLSYINEIKKKYNGEINKLIIATNINFDDDLKNNIEPLPLKESIPILDFIKEKTLQKPENWKFKEGDFPHRKKICKQLESTYASIKLVKELVEYVLNNKPITEKSFLASYFYDLIDNKIIDGVRFHRDFIAGSDGLSDKAKSFRNFLFKVGFKDSKESLNSNFNISEPSKFAEEIALLMNADKDKNKITIKRSKQIIKDNIDKLADYVFVEDKKNEVRFSKVFWEDDDTKLPGNLKDFRSELRTNFINLKLIDQNDNGLQIYQKLSKHSFKIANFKTCKEILVREEIFWKTIESFNEFNIDLDKIEMIRLAKNHDSLLRKNIILPTGKFSDNFKRGNGDLPDESKRFRIFLLKVGFEDSRGSLNSDFDISKPEEFAEEIASLMNADKDKDKITIKRSKQIIKDNIDKLADYVLVEDKKNEVRFSKVFWEDTKLPGNLKDFRNGLRANFINLKLIDQNYSGLQIYQKLSKYSFKITNFKTCKERLINKETFWKDIESNDIKSNINDILQSTSNRNLTEKSLDDIESDIKEFFDKLTFVVNYSQETLDEFIKKKCSWFTGFDTDYIAYEFQDKIAKALNLEVKGFISTSTDVNDFFEKAKDKLNSLVLIGPTLLYKAQIEEYGIKFQEKYIKKLFKYTDNAYNPKSYNFLNSDKNVLSLVTEQNDLTSIKAYQAVSGQYEGEYIFMCLSSILRIKEHVLSAFKERDLLIIECDYTNKDIQGLYSSLKSKLYGNKKIILIAQENNLLNGKFKDDFSGNNRYDERKDERNSLTDLTPDSQNKLLEKKEVIFQGKKEVSLDTLVDDESKHLIDGKVLSKLINNERIEIGKALTDWKYDDVKDYYIPRKFYRHISIKKDFKDEFFVTYNDQVTELDIQQNQDQDIVLVSDMEDDFNNLCEKYEGRNIHWLKESEIDNFIWQQSHGSLSNTNSHY